MKKKTLAVVTAILILCLLLFCGCEININLPENPSENSSESSSENLSESSSGSESSQSGVVSPGKRPFNPETSEPIHENNEDPDSYESLINTLYYTESVFGEAFIGYIEGPMGTGYEEFFEERGYLEKYPFIAEIPYERYVETNGNEMYCIVPRDKNSSVSVNVCFVLLLYVISIFKQCNNYCLSPFMPNSCGTRIHLYTTDICSIA